MGDFIFLQVVFDSKKQIIEYVGIAWAIDFGRDFPPNTVSFVPCRSNFQSNSGF
jgi:hypothetical protein